MFYPILSKNSLTVAETVVQPPISSAYYGHPSLSHSSSGGKARLAPSLRPRHAPGFGRHPWEGWVATQGEAAQGIRHASTSFRHRDKTAYWGRLSGFASAVAQPLRLQGFALLHLQAFVGSALPICFKASLRYAFKPSPLPILAPSLEPALAPNAFPITTPLSDLALASPLRFARLT